MRRYINQINLSKMLRIDEAIARAKTDGRKIMKKEIAARLWPDTSPVGQQVNMSALCSGKKSRINIEWVGIICEMTGCSADFLFGLSND